MVGCCRPTTRFGACLCALIRSIPYISLAGFGCMVMGFLLITANLVPLFDFVRDHILDPEQSNSYSRRVINGAYTYYWIVTFIALAGCLFSLFLSLFGTGWVHEQCCGIKRSLGKGPSACLNFVSSTFMVLQAVMVIFFFLLTLLAVLAFTLAVVFAGSREGMRNICNSPPIQIYNRAANISVCTQVYEEYYRIDPTSRPTGGSITANITRLDDELQAETYTNSTCLNLKQYNRDLVNIKCGDPFNTFCDSATTTKLRTAAGALVAGTSFFLMSCLLFLASTPANYVRFRQLPEYRILNTNDGGGRRGGAGASRLEDEEEDWSEDVDDEEDVSPKGRGRGGRAGGRPGRGGTGGRGRRQQAGGQFSVQDDDDMEMDDSHGHGHGAVPVHTLPPGAHAVVVAAAEEETARLRRAREALEAEAEAVRKRRQEHELEDERERTVERERRRIREEADANERMERMRRQLDDEKRQLEAERAALRQQQQQQQQQASVQSAVASQAQAQQQSTLNKAAAAGSTESTTDTTITSPDNSVSAM